MRFPDYTKQPDKVPVSPEEIDRIWEQMQRLFNYDAQQNKKITALEREVKRLKQEELSPSVL